MSTSSNLQDGGLPLIGCPRKLIQYICSHTSNWKPFLHLQPEDTPCHVDRDPIITMEIRNFKKTFYIKHCNQRLLMLLFNYTLIMAEFGIGLYMHLYHSLHPKGTQTSGYIFLKNLCIF